MDSDNEKVGVIVPSKTCRVCMKQGRTINLFVGKITDDKVPLYEIYEEIVNISISADDGYPEGICFSCTSRLKDAYILKKESEKTIEMLRDMKNVERHILEECPDDMKVEFLTSNIEDSCDEDDPNLGIDAVEFLAEKQSLENNRNIPKSTGQIVERKHECQVCFKKFLRKSNLVDHLRLHANVKLFKCEYCTKAFVQSGNYKAHLRTHTNERPFVCRICGKSYNQSSALKIHVRTHTNERNYVCDVCEKAFTNSSDLGKHKRVHDPSKKIKCDYCEKSFAQRANLRLHQKNNHRDKIESND